MSSLPPSLTARLGPLPSSFVDPATRATVDRALVVAKAELGLASTPIDVKWFTGAPFSAGFVYGPEPTTVWLSATLEHCDPRQIVEVVAHELAHVADHVQGRGQDEARALAFGERVAALFSPAE